MNNSDKLSIILKVLKALVFKIKIPLAITWNITYRCNLKCGYCGAHESNPKELDTEKVLAVISEFIGLGTKFVKFSGGEPLLRDDIGEIVDYCSKQGLSILMNSNGTLVKSKINEIKKISEMQISLDGTKAVHDLIRGPGTFDKAIEAIEICKNNGINVIITTVISRYNASCIQFVVDLAEEYNIGIQFQPVEQLCSTNSSKDINLFFGLNELEYKKIIVSIIEMKKNGKKSIQNSFSGLRHIYHWPHSRKVKCLLDLIHCHIEPDGRIFICNEFRNYQRYLVKIQESYKKAFLSLSLPYRCTECWCSDSEYCMCADFKPDSIFEMYKRLKHQ